jgi:hypothetical protein
MLAGKTRSASPGVLPTTQTAARKAKTSCDTCLHDDKECNNNPAQVSTHKPRCCQHHAETAAKFNSVYMPKTVDCALKRSTECWGHTLSHWREHKKSGQGFSSHQSTAIKHAAKERNETMNGTPATKNM